MTATQEKNPTQITVPIPMEQLEEIHEIYIQWGSILSIAQHDDGSAEMSIVLRPLADRMANVVVEEWETMMDKAKKNGGAQ